MFVCVSPILLPQTSLTKPFVVNKKWLINFWEAWYAAGGNVKVFSFNPMQMYIWHLSFCLCKQRQSALLLPGLAGFSSLQQFLKHNMGKKGNPYSVGEICAPFYLILNRHICSCYLEIQYVSFYVRIPLWSWYHLSHTPWLSTNECPTPKDMLWLWLDSTILVRK